MCTTKAMTEREMKQDCHKKSLVYKICYREEVKRTDDEEENEEVKKTEKKDKST